MEVKKIVTAVDLGPDTEAIISYATWLARLTGPGTSLMLLHVLDYALTPPSYLVRYIEDEKKQALAILGRWSLKLRDEQNVAAGYEVVMGRFIEAVGSYLREKRSDVLVIGHRHHMLRSSSAGRLIRSLRQPMLVVRGVKAKGIGLGAAEVRRILCPIDFSENSKKALCWAGSLAKNVDADLTVLHVHSDYNLLIDKDEHKEAKEMESYYSDSLADAGIELSNLVKEIDAGQQPVSVVTRSGDPVAAINGICSGTNIDLVVMGARGKAFFEGLLLGSVSESVVRASPCPVFILH
ncbi:MAG: universal stress protein [Dissulfurispiraceae bacterium]